MSTREGQPQGLRPHRILGVGHKLSRPDMMLEERLHYWLRDKTKYADAPSHNEDHHGTCFDGDMLKAYKDLNVEQFHLVFADAPFNIGKDYATSDNRPYADFANFLLQTIQAAKYLLHPHGTFIIMNNQRNMPVILSMALAEGFYLQNIIVWPIRSSVPNDERLERIWQPIMIFTKRLTTQYFDPFVDMTEWSKEEQDFFGRKEKYLYPHTTKQYRRQHDIWYDIHKVDKAHNEAFIEEDGSLTYQNTQMPMTLCQRLIRTYCPRNAWIFDMFAGSGAMLATANTCSRHWIGCEINADYANRIKENADVLVERWKSGPLPGEYNAPSKKSDA